MTRKEEKALVRAVLEIGRKVAALKHEAVNDNYYNFQDERELLQALQPLRDIVDGYDRRRRRPQ